MEEFRDLGVRDEAQLARIKAEVSASSLYNEDLAPTGPEERTWTTYNLATLWIEMSIVITTYLLASGLIPVNTNPHGFRQEPPLTSRVERNASRAGSRLILVPSHTSASYPHTKAKKHR